MAACKYCGADNSDDAVYCEDCGAQLGATSAAADHAGELEIGQVVDGRYRVEALLEAGPINRYRVRHGDRSLLLLQGRTSDNLQQQRVILQHIRGQVVFCPEEFFQEGEQSFAVGPLPHGDRLEDRVNQQGPLEPGEVERLARVLLAALEEVHDQNILSRSLQPSRIWLEDGNKVVIDLWDRAIDIEDVAMESESIAVTPGFSAPEMYGLGELGRSSDIFSAAAVLHYCLSGERPNFEARESFFCVAPPQVEGVDSLVYVIMRSLSKNQQDRFSDALAALAALDDPPPPCPEPVHAMPSPAPRPLAQAYEGGASRATSTAVATPVRPAHTEQKIQVALKTDIGCVRSINQDACLELKFSFYEKGQPHEAHLVTVIDGMGGEAEGDKAASIALRTIAQGVIQGSLALRDGRQTTPLLPSDPSERCRVILQRALLAANRNIYDYACLSDARRGMGCTITACILFNGMAHFAHVGDTRGYHLHQEVEQVTTDHSLVSRLVAMGTLTPEEARTSPQRSIIFRAMGTTPELEVDLYDRKLAPGDRLVLCSDGVWEYYEAQEFAQIVHDAPNPEALCNRLVEICLRRGADDNATVAVIDV